MRYHTDNGVFTMSYGKHDRLWRALQDARKVVQGGDENNRARFECYARDILWHNLHPNADPEMSGYVSGEDVAALVDMFPLILVASGIPEKLPANMLQRALRRAVGKAPVRPEDYKRVMIEFRPASGVPIYSYEGTIAEITQEATPERIMEEIRKESRQLEESTALYRNQYGLGNQ